MKIEQIGTDELVPYANNAKLHSDSQIDTICKSIKEFGFNNPVLIDSKNGIIAGHGRVLAAKKMGLANVPCVRLGHLTENQKKAYTIADNRLAETGGGWDGDRLKDELLAIDWSSFGEVSLKDFEFDNSDFIQDKDIAEDINQQDAEKSLADRFGVAPFSVLNAREGVWQERKLAWLALGIKSELGRGEQLIPNGGAWRVNQNILPPQGAASGL